MATHTDRTKRHDFVFLFDVTHGNPNGDPDAGNMPRMDPATMQGLVTDVALKRKIRDFVNIERNMPIFIQSETALNRLMSDEFVRVGVQPAQTNLPEGPIRDWFEENNFENFDLDEETLTYLGDSARRTDIQRALAEAWDQAGDSDKPPKNQVTALAAEMARNAKTPTGDQRESARKGLFQRYFDIRMFGAVLSTGLNAGQVRGPVQLGFARSIDPIFPFNHAITRCAVTREADKRLKETEMGRKATVRYGLYRAHGHYTPAFGEVTGVNDEDLEILWEALSHLFQNDRSAARAEMHVRGLYVFSHEHRLGNAPDHQLFRTIDVPALKDTSPEATPCEFEQYTVTVPRPETLPAGVTFKSIIPQQ